MATMTIATISNNGSDNDCNSPDANENAKEEKQKKNNNIQKKKKKNMI